MTICDRCGGPIERDLTRQVECIMPWRPDAPVRCNTVDGDQRVLVTVIVHKVLTPADRLPTQELELCADCTLVAVDAQQRELSPHKGAR